MPEHEFEFTIETGEYSVTVSGDTSIVHIEQSANDPDREPGDIDVIVMDMKTAREMHRQLGEILATTPRETDTETFT